MSVSPPSPLSVQYLLTYSLLLRLLHMCVMPTPAACLLTGMRTATLTLFTFRLILCLYSFHSLCVCNICMSVFNVLCGCDKVLGCPAVNYETEQICFISSSICHNHNSIFVIFVLVYCASIIAHIYYDILLLYNIKILGKSFTLSRKTLKHISLGLGL